MSRLKYTAGVFCVAFLAYLGAVHLLGVAEMPVLREFLYVGMIFSIAARGLIAIYANRAKTHG